MSCERCGTILLARFRAGTRYCSTRCRVAAHRAARRLPAVMTARRAWVRADCKRPIMADGRPASSTDPATWADFADVQSGAGDGLGVMLGGGLACWDFDHCLSGEGLDPAIAARLAELEPVWVERSMSGTGLHVFVLAPEGPGRKSPGVEFYSRARFIRVTGRRFAL